MRDTDFKNLLQGIREAGFYLSENKKAAARVLLRVAAKHPKAVLEAVR